MLQFFAQAGESALAGDNEGIAVGEIDGQDKMAQLKTQHIPYRRDASRKVDESQSRQKPSAVVALKVESRTGLKPETAPSSADEGHGTPHMRKQQQANNVRNKVKQNTSLGRKCTIEAGRWCSRV